MKTYENAKVLITGGLGFIGSNLARSLVGKGADVTLVDSLIPQYGGNAFNIEDIRQRVTMTDPQTDLDINAAAQLSILETCRKVNPGVKIVFASTRQLYGRPDYLPVDERHPVRPVDVNGINKLAGEWYHLLYNSVYGIRACALRLTNTYGPGMRVKDARQTFLGIWIRNLIEGKPLLVFGDGAQLRDFNYVDDVVEALLLAALSDKADGQVFNLGSSEVVGLKQLAQMLVAHHPGGSYQLIDFPADRKVIDIGDYYSDFSKIRQTLGWEPKTALKQGLQKSLAYYAQHQKEYWEADK
jgi:dTDP-glucose 4,6-dehydratase/UDP-glucose 4-epimerase